MPFRKRNSGTRTSDTQYVHRIISYIPKFLALELALLVGAKIVMYLAVDIEPTNLSPESKIRGKGIQ